MPAFFNTEKEVSSVESVGQKPQFSSFGELSVAPLTSVLSIKFPYNINDDIVHTELVGSGTITQADSMGVLSTGLTANSSASFFSKEALNYSPGIGVTIRFTSIFTPGIVGTTQMVGFGDSEDGFFFGYNGSEFGILKRQNGTDLWVSQSDWIVDSFDGNGKSGVTLDQTKGNVYQVKFQWLGYGAITYSIENPDTGQFEPVHIIKYANRNIVPSIYNPTLPLCAMVDNGTTGIDIVMRTPSMAALIEGVADFKGHLHSAVSNVAIGASSETLVQSIRSKTIFVGKTNRVNVRMSLFSMAVDGAKSVIIRVYRNGTITGGTWSDIEINDSVMESNETATYTKGILIYTFILPKAGGYSQTGKFFIRPGDSLTITAESAGTSIVDISTSWEEQV